MNNLYTDLAEVYEAMYQTFINYEEEFQFYAQLLENGNCRSIVEIGCGSGHLAPRFAGAGFQYTGLDLSTEMLAIAQHKYPQLNFLQADMRHFDLPEPTDGAIMTGRTISYLLHSQDVADCLASVRRNLAKGGLFCFDFIDASRFIPQIREGEKIIHRAEYNGRQFYRDSFWKMNPMHGWAFDWHSVYYEALGEKTIRLGEDRSTIRTFTKDEIELFLHIAGFEVLDCLDRPSYAFDTYVMVVR
jgi:SAM-dependent methyltransferase